MDKTIKILFSLLLLAGCAYAQTYKTVTADTNNVIRTNFILGSAQITGSFAISNVTGLQTALDGKLATNGDASALTNHAPILLRTNGDASGLTNFPAVVLTTNSAASAFPAALLRTNGDASGLSNLPPPTLSNVAGFLAISNGGTGATNVGGALTNLTIYQSNNTVLIGQSATSFGVSNSVIIGASATVDASSDHRTTVIGSGAESRGTNSVVIGWNALVTPSSAIQLGTGTNVIDNGTFQVFSWGGVDSNEWGALANAGTVGTNLLRSTNITGAQAAIFTNTTTNAPTNTNAPTPSAWLDVRVGTNNYKLPLWQ